jgi:autotransporter-associated beta strand protein
MTTAPSTFGGSGSYSFNGNIENNALGSPVRVFTLVKSGNGTQALGGTNAYSGNTTLNGGVLKLDSANALPGGIGATGGTSALLFSSGIRRDRPDAASGDFTRAIQGLTPGPDKVGWTNGGQGGFAAFGGDRSVNFGGEAATVTWATGQGVLANLILGHSTADSKVTVVNPIDLGGFARTVLVNDGSAAVDGEFSGVISGGGELNKNGTGTLELTGNNTYGAATNVLAGTLRSRACTPAATTTSPSRPAQRSFSNPLASSLSPSPATAPPTKSPAQEVLPSTAPCSSNLLERILPMEIHGPSSMPRT